MCKNKKANLVFFKDLFESRRFKIPEYQRGYSWENKHREDLLEDIEFCRKHEKYTHYMGTIVAAKPDENGLYEIVDGQQRILSLYILSKVIYDTLPKSTSEKKRLRGWFEKTGKTYLAPNKEVNESFYRNNILDNIGPIDSLKEIYPDNNSQKNIKDALIQFKKWALDEKRQINEYLNIILDRMGFKLYTPKSDEEIGIMFEVINNRGKPLSELEKVKNYLVYYSQKNEAENHRKIAQEVNDKWGIIIKKLSESGKVTNEDENAFLRACWIVFGDPDQKKSYHVYDNIKLKKHFSHEHYTETKRKMFIKFIKFMESCSRYYKKLFSNSNPHFQRLRFHTSHAAILPLYFAVSEVYDKDDIIKHIDLIEKLNFRIYMTPQELKFRSDRFQGELFRMAHNLYWSNNDNELKQPKTEIDKNNLDSIIKHFLTNNSEDGPGATLEMFVKSLTLRKNDENFDYYNWKALRYFLANYENSLYSKQDINKGLESYYEKNSGRMKLEIEHLWPEKYFPAGANRPKDNHEKNRLGNFALLEKKKNIQGSNKNLKYKLDKYFSKDVGEWNTHIRMIEELHDIREKAIKTANEHKNTKHKNWWYLFYQKTIDLREQKMLNFAIKRWGFEEEQNSRVKVNSIKADDGDEVFIKKNWNEYSLFKNNER